MNRRAGRRGPQRWVSGTAPLPAGISGPQFPQEKNTSAYFQRVILRAVLISGYMVFGTCVAQILAVILIVLGFFAIMENVMGIIYNGAFISSPLCVFYFQLEISGKDKRRMWKANLFPTEAVYKCKIRSRI